MSQNDCASITWAINNFTYSWQKNDEAIVSPMFCIYMPEETKWKLLLFPRGVASNDDYVSFLLYRDKDCNGPEQIRVEYSFDILSTDGSCLIGLNKRDEFRKDMRNGSLRYMYRILTTEERMVYMPQDILTIRCKMFRFDGETVQKRQIFARTIIGIQKQFFQWPVVNFSNLVPDLTQSVVIKSESKDVSTHINIAVTNEENICLAIDSFDPYMKFFAVKTFIIDSQKKEVDSGQYEHWFNCGKYSFPLKLTKRELIENKSRYLPNDVLTLRFELAVSTGLAFEGIEKAVCECSPHPFPNKVTENWRKCITHKKIADCPCALITDLTSLHKDQSTSDMKLQTKTVMFPVHTLILSARSPVFKAMFSNEMKEKINGCVDVSDLHDETVRQFLLYLYSDQLEDLKWDDAVQLYKVADKYAVISLRDKCSTFLKSNFNIENTCEALMLSDLHQDKDLKVIAQNFILRNAKVIFKSEKWKLLAEANSKLALETTLRNWNED